MDILARAKQLEMSQQDAEAFFFDDREEPLSVGDVEIDSYVNNQHLYTALIRRPPAPTTKKEGE